MSIFFKFKSHLKHDKLSFAGSYISVGELKAQIANQKQLNSRDFDLKLINEQTNIEYSDNTQMIPSNTSIVVMRVHRNQSDSAKWQKTPQQTGSNGFSSSGGRQNYSNNAGAPPEWYKCHRCNKPGHWINNCPTNDDPEFNFVKMKTATGIPRSYLKVVPDEDTDGTDATMMLPEGSVAVLQAHILPIQRLNKRRKHLAFLRQLKYHRLSILMPKLPAPYLGTEQFSMKYSIKRVKPVLFDADSNKPFVPSGFQEKSLQNRVIVGQSDAASRLGTEKPQFHRATAGTRQRRHFRGNDGYVQAVFSTPLINKQPTAPIPTSYAPLASTYSNYAETTQAPAATNNSFGNYYQAPQGSQGQVQHGKHGQYGQHRPTTNQQPIQHHRTPSQYSYQTNPQQQYSQRYQQPTQQQPQQQGYYQNQPKPSFTQGNSQNRYANQYSQHPQQGYYNQQSQKGYYQNQSYSQQSQQQGYYNNTNTQNQQGQYYQQNQHQQTQQSRPGQPNNRFQQNQHSYKYNKQGY